VVENFSWPRTAGHFNKSVEIIAGNFGVSRQLANSLNAESVRQFQAVTLTLKAFANSSPGLRFGKPWDYASHFSKTQL